MAVSPELLKNFPSLTSFDLLAAQVYYQAHQDKKALRQLSYDVLTSYETGNANQGTSDDQVLQTATAKNRSVGSVITFNRDDFLALHCNGIEHSDIVICKDDSNTQGIGQSLHDYLGTQETLQNRLVLGVS